MSEWGSPVEQEIKRRIKLSVAAYAYEFLSDSIMSDHEFDQLSLKVDKNMKTGNKKLDKFFKKWFDPSTGSWVWMHPEREMLNYLYEKYYGKK